MNKKYDYIDWGMGNFNYDQVYTYSQISKSANNGIKDNDKIKLDFTKLLAKPKIILNQNN